MKYERFYEGEEPAAGRMTPRIQERHFDVEDDEDERHHVETDS